MTLPALFSAEGASGRMVKDKASLLINGRPMVKWVERLFGALGPLTWLL